MNESKGKALMIVMIEPSVSLLNGTQITLLKTNGGSLKVVLLTDDRANKEKAEQHGLIVYRCKGHLFLSFLLFYIASICCCFFVCTMPFKT